MSEEKGSAALNGEATHGVAMSGENENVVAGGELDAASSADGLDGAADNAAARHVCVRCGKAKPPRAFGRRSGRRGRTGKRRNICRACSRRGRKAGAGAAAEATAPVGAAVPKRLGPLRPALAVPSPPKPQAHAPGRDISILRVNRDGFIKMRGKTDRGKRWVQDTDLATALNLVEEHAAVVVNAHTIRRLYSNKEFRQFIMTRDQYTCYYCGGYGDTLDHIVPRSKGGHTTPLNCICACHECNQSKANRDVAAFIEEETM